MQNILLPTDLTIASLYPVHEICRRAKAANQGRINVYIIHTLEMPVGVMDLLFPSDRKPYNKLSPGFREGLEMLREKYADVLNKLCFEFVLGHYVPLLRNYCQHRNIESIYILEDYKYEGGIEQTVNCVPVLEKCRIPLEYVAKGSVGQHRVLTTLLYTNKNVHI